MVSRFTNRDLMNLSLTEIRGQTPTKNNCRFTVEVGFIRPDMVTGLMNQTPTKVRVKFTINERYQLELYSRIYFKTEEKNEKKAEK